MSEKSKFCLLFDCDGTLVDSEILSHQTLKAKFHEYGVSLDLEDLVGKYKGKKLAFILEQLESEHNIQLPSDFEKVFREKMNEIFHLELRPIKGAKSALEKLAYTKAVVSNGPRKKIETALTICGLKDFFEDKIFSAYDFKIWKPNPNLYLNVAKIMNYSPTECIVIEDTLVGVEAGVRAGMKTLFYNPLNVKNPFSKAQSFESMNDLQEIIKELKI